MTTCGVIDTAPPADQKPDAVDLTTVEKLLILRRRLGLTASAAARRWHLNVRTLRSWEAGARAPMPITERRLLRIVYDEERKAS